MIAKVNVGTTATLVQAAKGRCAVALQNQSDTDIYVALEGSSDLTTDAGAKPGLKIAAGGSLTMLGGDSFGAGLGGAIYAIHGGAGNKVLVLHSW